ncbi:MAG: hypothetical protein ABIP63_05465 [Thermoanaerobaculia bacterium]
MLRNTLRFSAGLVLGAALWWYATPAYNRFLAFAAQPLVHLDTRYAKASLAGRGRGIEVSGPSIPPARIPADQYTASLVLLMALFAMRRDLFHDRGLRSFALSLLVVVAMHVVAMVVGTEATYAVRLPEWGDRHYSGTAQDLWQAAEFVYRIGAMFAIPFACYWVTSPEPADAPRNKNAPVKRRRRR